MSTAIETIKKTPLRQVKTVKDLLWNDQAKEQLAAVAARHMSPERLMRVVANSIRTTPLLQECEPMSLLGGLMQCAALGLEPQTVLGHAYLIPFKNNRKNIVEVQVVVGYRGLIDLARRSGHITSIHAGIHYKDDELWVYEEGTEAQLRHKPGPQSGEKLHAYAIAKFKDGGHAYVVLPWSHVLRIRNGSQGYQTAIKYGKKDNPWIAHEDAMAKKTAIRALAKYLPLSVEFVDALQVDGSRADYRAFAMDPTQGLTIDAEADDATGEVETDDGPAMVEDAKTVHPETTRETEPAKPARTAAPRQAKPKEAAPAEEQRRSEPERAAAPVEEERQDETAAEPDTQQGLALTGVAPGAAVKTLEQRYEESAFCQMVLRDLYDMGRDPVLEMHDEAIAGMKRRDPELVARLMQDIDNY